MPLVLQQDWVGRRVVLRRRIYRAEGTVAGLSDVVGDLLELDAQHARVAARGGDIQVALGDITHTRLVEASTAETLALELTCLRGWQAAETHEANGWVLRANAGFSSRANSVLALYAPRPSLDTALEDAAAWYGTRGLPLRIHVPLPARRLLDDELASRGWAIATEVHVMAARIDRLLGAIDAIGIDRQLPAAEVADFPADGWLGAYHHPTAPTGPMERDLLVRHERAAFASIRMDDEVVAIARGVIDDGWLGVAAVAVEQGHRRRGLAIALMAALGRWAVTRHGATRSYLQVDQTNTAAIALYRRLGYHVHHDYRCRTLTS